ncbi:MAG: transcription antitermination factor NusB [Bacteroidaceae bacterium]|nr:transcription antitermination factor NusB [Bacteroidaceae bacterium]
MINRTLIRLKIVQLMYAFYQNGGKEIEMAEKELLFSLSKAYDLYNYLLMLIVAINRYALKQLEHKEEVNKTAHIDEKLNRRFVDNKFAVQLESNVQLEEHKQKMKKTWDNDINFVKKIYDEIVASEYYKEYMEMESTTYEDDRELWRKLYKNIIMKNEELDDILEDQSLYWNDDRSIIDTFVLKTIKRFEEQNEEKQELIADYKDDEDRDFALKLFRRCIQNDEYYRSLISRCVKNWEFNRLAYMDIVIMQIAIAEVLSFPLIPVSVTINEYVEIAKWYSTPKSGGYINGTLDAVCRMLRDEHKLMKA